MPSTKELRRRIRVVKNIEKITSAMKMVASARLRRAQEQANAARPYAEKMQTVMSGLAQSTGSISHPLLEKREVKHVAFLIVGAERGLAGSYNQNVMSRAMKALAQYDKDQVKLLLAGKKAVTFFKRQDYEVAEVLETPGVGVSFNDIRGITTTIRDMFESGEVDAVKLVYAKFISAMNQEPTVVDLLPMSSPESADLVLPDFEFEPEAEELLGQLLPKYVDTQIYQAIVEAQASEQGARMTAMSAATKNAGEMITNLTLQYNKMRQTAITTEIMEIVVGAEALK